MEKVNDSRQPTTKLQTTVTGQQGTIYNHAPTPILDNQSQHPTIDSRQPTAEIKKHTKKLIYSKTHYDVKTPIFCAPLKPTLI
jgi:hypothetical protein